MGSGEKSNNTIIETRDKIKIASEKSKKLYKSPYFADTKHTNL
jgi:hypothetical protein